MKILHVTESVRLIDGGVARAVLDLMSVLNRCGHTAMILTMDALDVPAQWKDAKDQRVFKLKTHSTKLGRLFLADRSEVKALVQSVDFVHIHQPWHPLVAQIAQICRSAGVPYCVSLHGTLDTWSVAQQRLKKSVYMAMFGRRMLEGAAFVHCTAAEEQRQSEPWYPRGRTVVVPCVMDLSPFANLPGPELARAHFGLNDATDRLLYLSRIHPKKGLYYLIESMPKVLEARSKIPGARDIEVCVAGPQEDAAYFKEIQRLISTLGLERKIRFIGHVNGAMKLSLYQACNAFVLPSSQENFGFVLFEAMVCATPVIVTNLVDTWRELRDHGGATIVDQNAASVADGILQVLAMPASARQEMCARGRAWVLQYLEESSVGTAMAAAYQSVR
jgi:glycosyltransferase involved in cell wall biosynthesis